MIRTLQSLKLLFFLLLGVFLQAQSNNGSQSFEMVKNTVLEDVSVNSMIKPITVVQPTNGSVSYSYLASGVYEMKYTPDVDFIGSDYFVAEYYVNNGIPTPKYIHFNLEVKETIIRTSADFANTSLNQPVTVFALDNDFATHGPLTIVAASFVTGGSIVLGSSSELIFTPETDYVGDAYVNYIVQDTLDFTAIGTIKIGVQDSINVPAFDQIIMATTNRNPATILLPLSGFIVDTSNAPVHGSIEFAGTDVVEYTSNLGNDAKDTFSVVIPGSYEREIIIETINIPEPNGFVIDDYVITTVGEAVTFDVQANDIKKNFPITDFTQANGLVQDSLDESVFTYTPPANFEGEKVFSYTVTNGVYNETGYITILVSNFTPENNAIYNLTTPRNTPLVINYDIPISNFSFIENLSPANGSLDIYEGIDTISVGCESISGYNLVTYTPEEDYVGADQFEILYCVDNNNCQLVKVFLEVEDIGLDSICLCVADCVWAGDSDNDGKVSVADLLPIAYHQGLYGEPREEAGVTTSWFGQHAEDWDVNQVYNEEDVKHVDSNGDGLIAGDDLVEIESYYNRFHSLVAPDNLVIKDYPFELHTDQDTVYAGEYIHFDIIIGTEEYPALNLHGLAYGLTFPASLIDSSTLQVDFLNEEWFGANSAALEMAVQPVEGRIEASFSRTSGIPVSGYGLVASVDFIIEDDVQGIKAGDEIIEMKFYLEPMVIQGLGGEQFTLPPFEKILYLDLRGRESIFDSKVDINVYPNPSRNEVFVHANNQVKIEKVQVINSNGQVIRSEVINFETARLQVSDLVDGLYFIRVETASGTTVRKFTKL